MLKASPGGIRPPPRPLKELGAAEAINFREGTNLLENKLRAGRVGVWWGWSLLFAWLGENTRRKLPCCRGQKGSNWLMAEK